MNRFPRLSNIGLILLVATVPIAWNSAGAVEPFFQSTVYYAGMNGYNTYRIPAIVASEDGTLLAFAEGRKNSSSDSGDIDLVLRRSLDNGRTWGPMQIIWSNGNDVAGNPVPIVDSATGDIVLLTIHEPSTSEPILPRVYHVQRSTDDGLTWTDPARIDVLDSLSPTWVAGGPNHGIQLTVGEHAGRLICPGNHVTSSKASTRYGHALYSDDGGFTWELGASGGATPEINVNEMAAVELADGTIYFTARDQNGSSAGTRAYSTSSDGGESFDADFQIDRTILAPVCQGSILRYTGTSSSLSDDRILQSYPNSATRERIAVRSSFDEAQTWTKPKVIYEGSSAYSDLVQTPDDRIALLYERDNYGSIRFASFTTDWLDEGTLEVPVDISGGEFLGFWALDDGAGQTAADSSGNGRNGRLGDATTADALDPTWVQDSTRGTVALFGDGKYVDLSEHVNAFEGLEQGTISLWLRTTGGTSMAAFAASDSTAASSEIRLIIEDGETMWYDVRDQAAELHGESGVIESVSSVTDYTWHHVVAVVGEDNTARLYVDGVLESDGTEPFFTVGSLDTMGLGRNVDSGGPQWFYHGLLSDVGVFDKPLSSAMVLAAYELDQEAELGYDLTQAVALFQLQGSETLELDGRTWYVVEGLTSGIGSLQSNGENFFVRLTREGTGIATIPGLLEGDADGDGLVGSGDLDIVRAAWGQTVTAGNWRAGDLTGDGFVGSADLDVIRANWGQTFSGTSAVPEPGIGLLLPAALCSGLCYSRRRK